MRSVWRHIEPLDIDCKQSQRFFRVVKEIRSSQQIMGLFEVFVDTALLSDIMSTIKLACSSGSVGLEFPHHPRQSHHPH